jgi:hypothetical protein
LGELVLDLHEEQLRGVEERVLLDLEAHARAETGEIALPHVHELAREPLLGPDLGELGPLRRGLEVGAVLDHAAQEAIVDGFGIGGEIDQREAIVVVAHHVDPRDRSPLDLELEDLAHVALGAPHDLLALEDREARGVIGEHQHVAPVPLLEEEAHPVVLAEPAEEVEVGLLVLDHELPRRVLGVEAQLRVRVEPEELELGLDDVGHGHAPLLADHEDVEGSIRESWNACGAMWRRRTRRSAWVARRSETLTIMPLRRRTSRQEPERSAPVRSASASSSICMSLPRRSTPRRIAPTIAQRCSK